MSSEIKAEKLSDAGPPQVAKAPRPDVSRAPSPPRGSAAHEVASVGATFDWKPLALIPVLALAVLPFIGSGSTWVTLTVAGLAMGMIIFIIASGLTLVFGLMDVLNFGHGVFIALGAFVATSVRCV